MEDFERGDYIVAHRGAARELPSDALTTRVVARHARPLLGAARGAERAGAQVRAEWPHGKPLTLRGRWLARLGDLGFGACLADDMSLGTTVQLIALLLHRARSGPALAIAPTSACENWLRELARLRALLNAE